MVNKSGDQCSLHLNEETGLLGVARTVVRATAGGYLISTANSVSSSLDEETVACIQDLAGGLCGCELSL